MPLENPIDKLAEGMAAGLQVRKMMQDYAMEKQRMDLMQRNAAIGDIQNQMLLQSMSRPVVNGTVTEEMPEKTGPATPYAFPSVRFDRGPIVGGQAGVVPGETTPARTIRARVRMASTTASLNGVFTPRREPSRQT